MQPQQKVKSTLKVSAMSISHVFNTIFKIKAIFFENLCIQAIQTKVNQYSVSALCCPVNINLSANYASLAGSKATSSNA